MMKRSTPKITRWSQAETANLIQKIKMGLKGNYEYPGNFEKPTANIFYNRYCKIGKLLAHKEIEEIKSKTYQLREQYFRIHDFIKEKESLGMDARTIRDKVLKMAPNYDDLHTIFESHLKIRENNANLAENVSCGDAESKCLPDLESALQLKIEVEEDDPFESTNDFQNGETTSTDSSEDEEYKEFFDAYREILKMKMQFRIQMEQAKSEVAKKRLEMQKEMAERQAALEKYKLAKEKEIHQMKLDSEERLRLYELKLQQKVAGLK